ncbi:MAG: RagB/SusD family nutrient uptake outer membrane protein [Prolixibacteraceae bacterium]
MIKSSKYLTIFLLLLTITGCEDYLNKKDPNTNYLTEDDIFIDPVKIKELAARLYDCVSWESGLGSAARTNAAGKDYGSIQNTAGEMISTRQDIAANTFGLPGNWQQLVDNQSLSGYIPQWLDSWNNSWEAIYLSNLLLEKFKNGEIKKGLLNPRLEKQLIGESFLFRAYGYSALIKRWGGMPLFTRRMLSSDDYNLPRGDYQKCVDQVVADCDSAVKYIPEASYLNDPEYMGRLGKAAAMALKSRTLTIAASPLNNSQNDSKSWVTAAQAAWDVITLSRANSDKIGLFTGNYNNIFYDMPGTIEDLWPRYLPMQTSPTSVYQHIYSWTKYAGSTSLGQSVTLETVNRFETANGWPIENQNSGYSINFPYSNRDPRFYKDIIYQGVLWPETADNELIDFRTSPLGKDRSAPTDLTYGNSKTGFMAGKLLPPKFNNKYTSPRYCNAPLIRMAEMYLNYAEAVNEAYKDPNAKLPGADLSAVDALNIIRNRVGHVNVRSEFTKDYLLFQGRVRNEFAVELCFEYHYWFDLLRWKTAVQELDGKNFHGLLLIADATKPGGIRHEIFEIPLTRNFKERNYRYPLRTNDLYQFVNLKQNPGW